MSYHNKPSAPWSRLRKPPADPLEDVGLVSKGDKRLLDPRSQEKYFSTIVTRYMRYCASVSRENDSLEEAFRSLNLDSSVDSLQAQDGRPASSVASVGELETIIMSMRKLREALVATSRKDGFTQRALTFITRATILTSTYEAYFPAILRLLHHVHPVAPLTQPELREFVGYYILDLACRQGSYSEALQVKHRWQFQNRDVDNVLACLMRHDWVNFWRIKAGLGTYQRRLLGFAEPDMRKHALKCLRITYFKVDKPFLERSAGRTWIDLQQHDNVEWDLEGDVVVIRRVGKKS